MKASDISIRGEISELIWVGSHRHADEREKAVAFGACMALLWVLGDKASVPSRITKRVLIEQLKQSGIPHCRVCGCTDNYACPGGCSWMRPGLCSKCAPAPLPTIAARRMKVQRKG